MSTGFFKGGAWQLSIRGKKFRLSVPLPVYVFTDLFESVSDLCALILPLCGLPNYAAMIGELFAAMGPPSGEPLLAVDADGVRVRLGRS